MNSSRGSTPRIDSERGGREAGGFPLVSSGVGSGDGARRARLSGGDVRACIFGLDHSRVGCLKSLYYVRRMSSFFCFIF